MKHSVLTVAYIILSAAGMTKASDEGNLFMQLFCLVGLTISLFIGFILYLHWKTKNIKL